MRKSFSPEQLMQALFLTSKNKFLDTGSRSETLERLGFFILLIVFPHHLLRNGGIFAALELLIAFCLLLIVLP
jgi:hypothetical protein